MDHSKIIDTFDTYHAPKFLRPWAFDEQMVACFQVSSAKRTEVVVRPTPLLQPICAPQAVLEQQPGKEVLLWGSPDLPNLSLQVRLGAPLFQPFIIGLVVIFYSYYLLEALILITSSIFWVGYLPYQLANP